MKYSNCGVLINVGGGVAFNYFLLVYLGQLE